MGYNSSLAVKICGITQISQAKAIASLGVNAIGVIGVKRSARFIHEEKRREIFSSLKKSHPKIQRVWVIADLEETDIQRALQGEGTPSVIQLHGEEPKLLCRQLKIKYPKHQWWKAVRLKSAEDLLKANQYLGSVDALLLDAWSSNQLGGTGNRLELEWFKKFPPQLPWWLAGGISHEWIPEIFKNVNPFGIDASSRLEKEPGIKDLNLVKKLIEAIENQTK